MSPRWFVLVTTLALVAPAAHAQDGEPAEQPKPARQAVPRQAVPRQDTPARTEERSSPRPQPAARPNTQERETQPRAVQPASAPRQQEDATPRRVIVPPTRAAEPVRQDSPAPVPSRVRQSNDNDQGVAVPRGNRPQGDNPRTGTAVPRDTQPPPRIDDRRDDRRNVIVSRAPIYYNTYSYPSFYYPQRYYPYGYGAFGLGYFYYDPYTWYPGYSTYAYNAGYPGRVVGFDTGELRIRVSPRNAQVFVDGYYVGVVDDFDGTWQSLRLDDGPYRIEIVAPGFETLAFGVRILRGEKITYRGDLLRIRP